MKVNISWIGRYVDIPESPEVLAHDLTMFGLNVEEVIEPGSSFKGIVFGRLLDVKPHPRADRLRLCMVDVGGEEPLRIVCGAPNVRPGLGVPVALHGSVLAGGLKIKRTKIRGEVSEGMICSETELEIGDDADGIIELDFEERPGASIDSRLGSNDSILDIEITPNRPDLLSHFGIAREIAALYKRELRETERRTLEPGARYDITIENGDDCPRYSAAFIDDVSIAPSPVWLQQLLTSVGIKPINNIVDITNFVLMELGQPLHAFDRDRLARDAVGVRRGKESETLVTLDGVERELTPDTLVIVDGEKPVAIAGVMGGFDTEVTDRTKRLVIESAMFNPRSVRRTRQLFKLETEASYRFEREGDIGITVRALERACALIEETGAGRPQLRYAEVLASGERLKETQIVMRARQTNRVMGTNLSSSEIASLLERLGLGTRVTGKTIQVSVPTARRDLKEEIDLIEEAARVYGYENIGRDEVSRCSIFSHVSYEERRNEKICNFFASRGFAEVTTSSFMDPGDIGRFGWRVDDPRRNAITVSNPLTVSQSILRTSLIPGLLDVVRRNTPAEHDGIQIFELGKVFIPERGGGGLPSEELHLTALLTRRSAPLQWMGEQRAFDFFDMKGEFEALMEWLGIASDISMAERSSNSNGLIINWLIGHRLLAEGGIIPEEVSKSYDVDTTVFFFDLLMDALPPAKIQGPRYSYVIPYPAVKRDLCVVAADRVTFADIRNIMKEQAKHLESIRLFDYYRGSHLGEGRRSYTIRLSFRSSEGTLDDSTVDREIERMLAALQRELQVVLREE